MTSEILEQIEEILISLNYAQCGRSSHLRPNNIQIGIFQNELFENNSPKYLSELQNM